MEEKKKRMSVSIDEYIKRIEKKLIVANRLEEVQTIKSKVVPKYIEAYNNNKLKESSLAKLSVLISKIQTKEKEIDEENTMENIEEKELELMKEYVELLKDINKIIELVDDKEE